MTIQFSNDRTADFSSLVDCFPSAGRIRLASVNLQFHLQPVSVKLSIFSSINDSIAGLAEEYVRLYLHLVDWCRVKLLNTFP